MRLIPPLLLSLVLYGCFDSTQTYSVNTCTTIAAGENAKVVRCDR